MDPSTAYRLWRGTTAGMAEWTKRSQNRHPGNRGVRQPWPRETQEGGL